MRTASILAAPEPFRLWMGRLGNGTTVCNSAVDDPEIRDYRQIAHINDAGIITWYVKPHTIPADARAAIEQDAERGHTTWLKAWSEASPASQYQRLLGWMSVGELIAYNQWLRGIPKPRDIIRMAETILSKQMCRRARTTYGL